MCFASFKLLSVKFWAEIYIATPQQPWTLHFSKVAAAMKDAVYNEWPRMLRSTEGHLGWTFTRIWGQNLSILAEPPCNKPPLQSHRLFSQTKHSLTNVLCWSHPCFRCPGAWTTFPVSRNNVKAFCINDDVNLTNARNKWMTLKFIDNILSMAFMANLPIFVTNAWLPSVLVNISFVKVLLKRLWLRVVSRAFNELIT